ncbi:MAG: hypothetical protein R3B90_19520 [Planctomycetaceae bacterium]
MIAAGTVLPFLPTLPRAFAAPTSDLPAETAVAKFYKTLTPGTAAGHLPAVQSRGPHEKSSANWHVTKLVIGDDFYTVEQRGIIDENRRMGATSGRDTNDSTARWKRTMAAELLQRGRLRRAVGPGSTSGNYRPAPTLRADGDTVDQPPSAGRLFMAATRRRLYPAPT